MTPAGGHRTPGGGGHGPGGRRAAGLLALSFVVLALVLAVGSAGASLPTDAQFQATNGSSVTLSDASAAGADTVEFVVGSDAGVAAGSIDGDDFAVSAGRVSSASVDPAGDDARVRLHLAAPVDSDVVTVSFAPDATVTDGDGAELATDGAAVEVGGMDTVPPRVERFAVQPANGTTVDLTVEASEPLDEVNVSVDGPASVTLQRENFTAADGGLRLTASVALPAAGDYRATVERVADEHGNDRRSGRVVTVATEDRPPTAVAGVDFAASSGTTLTLDASRSTAADPIASITWDLGDGAEATGERVTHRYRPGNYTATVTVTDIDGDVGTDRIVVDLTGNGSVASVGGSATVDFASNVTPSDGSAIVDVADPAKGPVRLARANETDTPVAAHDGVALTALNVTLRNASRYGLAIQADGPAAAGDVPNATGVLGALTVVHDVADRDVAGVTLSIAVEHERLPADADPAAVSVFRRSDGAWTRLNTTRVDDPEVAGPYRYRADSPGLSRFAVATASNGTTGNATESTPTPTEVPTATPSEAESNVPDDAVTVTNATANATSVEPGGSVTVSATVDNPGDAAVSYRAGLSVNGTVVDTRTVTVPGGEDRSVALNWSANATGRQQLTVNGTAAGTVSVGEGGGLLASVLGVFGFLPLGLFRMVLTYLGGVLVAVFLALKAVALLMGY